MKKCINCCKNNRDKDIYCRNCGVKLKSNIYYIIINTLTIISCIIFISIILLCIAVFLVR